MDTIEPIVVIRRVAIFPGSVVHSSLVGPSETVSRLNQMKEHVVSDNDLDFSMTSSMLVDTSAIMWIEKAWLPC